MSDKIFKKVKSKLEEDGKMIVLFNEPIFGSGKILIEQNKKRPATLWITPDNGKEFGIHHDAVDDFINLLKKAKKKMEENV